MDIQKKRKIGFVCGAVAAILTPISALAASDPVINAAVLPTSRTTTVDAPITVFGTISNSGASTASACSVGLLPDESAGGPNPAGVSVSYRAFEADNATPAAPQDTPVDIAPGASQAFVLSVAGSGPFNQEIYFDFSCAAGTVTAPVYSGVNTLSLLVGTTANPDIITIGTSPSKDAVVRIPSLGAGEIMAVAAVNIGPSPSPVAKDASGTMAGNNETPVIVAPDFGDYDLALDAFICETDPSTALCLAPYARTVSTNVGDQPSTFNVFVNSTLGAGVPLYADIARQYIRFYEDTSSAPRPIAKETISDPAALPPANSGIVYGATSHAVTSPGPEILPSSNFPDGIWSVAFDTAILDGTVRDQGIIAITVEGEWLSFVFDGGNGNGEMFQFGYLTDSNSSASPNPTLSIEFDTYENDINGGQTRTPYTGSGTWRPYSYISASVIYTPPAPTSKGVSETAISQQRPADFRAVYNAVYDRSVTFTDLAGNYDLLDNDVNDGFVTDSGDITIANDGTFTGIVNPEPGENCNVSGFLTEYGNGKNLFGVNMTLTGCTFADDYMGHGYQRDDTDLVEGALTPDVFGMIILGNVSQTAARLNLVPQGTVVIP